MYLILDGVKILSIVNLKKKKERLIEEVVKNLDEVFPYYFLNTFTYSLFNHVIKMYIMFTTIQRADCNISTV